MSETLPVVYLARHGDTAWTVSVSRDCPLAGSDESGRRNSHECAGAD